MSQEGVFAIKLSQLEHQCGQTLTRLRLYQERDHQKIREELKQIFGESRENEHLLQKAVNTGRSPAVAAQAMRYAHLVVLSAIDAQISLDAQRQEST